MGQQVLEMAPARCDRRTRSVQWLIRGFALWLIVCVNAYAGDGDARRIAVMDPGHVEILRALGAGDALTLMPEDPSFRQSLPEVARYRRMPTPEGLLAAGTTLVIGGNPGRDAPILARAESLGIESHMVSRERPALERIRRIAGLVDRQAEAEILIEKIQARYADAARVVAANDAPPKVLHVSSSGAGSTGAVTAAGRSTAVHGLIERAGGINVGARAGLERYQSLTAEGVIAMAPQAVLVSDLELSSLGGRDGIWRQVPGLAHTPAGRRERLIVLPHAAVKFDAVASGDATLALARALATNVTDAP